MMMMTSKWCNFCMLLPTVNCCQTERQIQWDAWGSAHTARISQQYLSANDW